MALHIARSTCNRAIYVLVEGPCYGYSNSASARLANAEGGFLPLVDYGDGTNMTCPDEDISITTVGWVPGEALPSRIGADGVEYAADSTSSSSPWFESMVFPENPSGVKKTPNLQKE